jgi:hypothetical protein
MRTPRRSIVVTPLMLLTIGTVFAQQPGMPARPDYPRTTNPQPDKQMDKAYRSAVEKIPVPKANSDPWGDVRSTSPPPIKNK